MSHDAITLDNAREVARKLAGYSSPDIKDAARVMFALCTRLEEVGTAELKNDMDRQRDEEVAADMQKWCDKFYANAALTMIANIRSPSDFAVSEEDGGIAQIARALTVSMAKHRPLVSVGPPGDPPSAVVTGDGDSI